MTVAKPPTLSAMGEPKLLPSITNCTVPPGVPSAGFTELTVAVKETCWPKRDGLGVEEMTTLVAAFTAINPLVPKMELSAVSKTLIVWLPKLFSVVEKVPTPLVSRESAGRTAAPEVLVKWTVPV